MVKSFRMAPVNPYGLRYSPYIKRNNLFSYTIGPTRIKREFLPIKPRSIGTPQTVGFKTSGVKRIRPQYGVLGSPIGKPARPIGKKGVRNSNALIFEKIGNGNGNKVRSYARKSGHGRKLLSKRRTKLTGPRMDFSSKKVRKRSRKLKRLRKLKRSRKRSRKSSRKRSSKMKMKSPRKVKSKRKRKRKVKSKRKVKRKYKSKRRKVSCKKVSKCKKCKC